MNEHRNRKDRRPAESNQQERERRSDTLALSGTATKIVVSVVSTGIIVLSSFLLYLGSSVARLDGDLKHLQAIEQLRHIELAKELTALKQTLAELTNFRDHGERFTARDGIRHDKRITTVEEYIAEHERWGRELTGGYRQLFTDIERRITNLERLVETHPH